MSLYRYPKLKELAVLEYPTQGGNDPKKAEAKSIKAMAKAWKKLIWEQAVGKRSEAVTIFKKIWLKNDSPFVLVSNVLVRDLRKGPEEMVVVKALVDTGVTTVDAVRELIRSADMYQNPAMYNLICGGVESGKFKQNPKRDPATISDLLTVAHEAAIRSELYFALEKAGFRHDPSIEHGRLRHEEWKFFCDLVYEDRVNNEKNAWIARVGALRFVRLFESLPMALVLPALSPCGRSLLSSMPSFVSL